MLRKSTDVQEEVKADDVQADAAPAVKEADVINELHKVAHILGRVHLHDAQHVLDHIVGDWQKEVLAKTGVRSYSTCKEVIATIQDDQYTKEYSLSTLASIIANLKKLNLDTYADRVSSARTNLEAEAPESPFAEDDADLEAQLFSPGSGLEAQLAQILASRGFGSGRVQVIVVGRGFGGFGGSLFGAPDFSGADLSGARFGRGRSPSPQRRSPSPSPDRDEEFSTPSITPSASPERSESPRLSPRR